MARTHTRPKPSSQNPDNQPLLVSIVRAGELLSMSRRSVERLIAKGELIAVGLGRLRRVSYISLLGYIERHRLQ